MDKYDFTDIYQQYFRKSFLFVKSFIRDEMASEDIVSETLLRLWQVIKEKEVKSIDALLFTMLKNSALNHLKHLEIKQNAIEKISSLQKRDLNYRINCLQSYEPEEIFSSEISEIIKCTLASLPKQTRLIFQLSRYKQMSVKEIAVELSLNPKSVEYHITKSLKALRLALKDFLPFFSFFY